MTGIEVWDSVVKIGLGALIGGVFSSFGLFKSHRHEFKREWHKRKQDMVDRLVDDFEKIQVAATNMYADFLEHRHAQHEEVKKRLYDKMYKNAEQAQDRSIQLHVMEGKLRLFGLRECAEMMMICRRAHAEVMSVCDPSKEVPDKEIQGKIGQFATYRAQLYEALFKAYRK